MAASNREEKPFVFGVIPARGGSKGLPGKNLKPLGGVPLIGWSIRAARECRSLDRVVVSTEDQAIASAAAALGAEVPFARPAELARDESPIVDVLRHAVLWLEKERGSRPDVVVLLQPTSPLREPRDIDETVRLVVEGGADSAQTVTEDRRHPFHRYLLENGKMVPLLKESERLSRRQDAPPVYLPTGSVYAVRGEVLMRDGALKGADHRALVRDFRVSVDVDDEFDLRLAAWLLESKAGVSA